MKGDTRSLDYSSNSPMYLWAYRDNGKENGNYRDYIGVVYPKAPGLQFLSCFAEATKTVGSIIGLRFLIMRSWSRVPQVSLKILLVMSWAPYIP